MAEISDINHQYTVYLQYNADEHCTYQIIIILT